MIIDLIILVKYHVKIPNPDADYTNKSQDHLLQIKKTKQLTDKANKQSLN